MRDANSTAAWGKEFGNPGNPSKEPAVLAWPRGFRLYANPLIGQLYASMQPSDVAVSYVNLRWRGAQIGSTVAAAVSIGGENRMTRF